MKNVVPLTIGNIDLDLVTQDPQLKDVLYQRYSMFLRENKMGYPIIIRWYKSSGEPAQIERKLVFSPARIDLISSGYTGEISMDGGAKLEINSLDPLTGIDYFLRLVIAQLAFWSGGLLFHGAGILHHGSGYVFFGHSGSGKTTISRLSTNDLVLNDDLLVLSPNEMGWKAYATPFWNPTQVRPHNRSMMIKGMYRLVKDRSVFLEPMSSGQAVGELIANTPVLPADELQLPDVLARCYQISLAIPPYWLHFLKDESFWNVINGV